MKLQFTKMHGAGNDFIVIDSTEAPFTMTTNQLRFIADRHLGIGADQILIVEKARTPVTVSGNTIIVKSVGAGSATITVKSAASTNYNEKTATYTVTVKNPTFTEGLGVGYYADTDGDGTPDGIIFADFKNGGSGSWGGYSYTISTVTGLKEYYVSKTNYNGPFGTKNVLSARGSGNARFNVMALSDYNNSATYTFTNAKSITSGDWRTPTKEDLTMFAGQLVIKPSNYSGYGLKATYWSSTVYNGSSGYYVTFNNDFDIFISFNGKYPVRLARTF